MCKEALETIVVTVDSVRPFREFDLDAMTYDSNLRIYFDDKVRNVKKLRDLARRRCPICLKDSFDTNAQLMNHAKEVHGKVFCVTCLRDRKVFPHEQRLYTETDLRRHIAEGDPAIGDEGAIEPHKKARAARAILARTRSGEMPLPLPILRRSQTTSPSSLTRTIPLVRTRSHGRVSPLLSAQYFRNRQTPPSSPRRILTSPRSASHRRTFTLQQPRKLTRSISAPSRNSSHKLFKTSPQILRALTAARRSRKQNDSGTAAAATTTTTTPYGLDGVTSRRDGY